MNKFLEALRNMKDFDILFDMRNFEDCGELGKYRIAVNTKEDRDVLLERALEYNDFKSFIIDNAIVVKDIEEQPIIGKKLDKEFIIELLQQKREALENQMSIFEEQDDMVNKMNEVSHIIDQIELLNT